MSKQCVNNPKDSKLHPYSLKFQQNSRLEFKRRNKNKASIIELLLTYAKEQKAKCLNTLNNKRVVFSIEETCFLLTFA